MTDAAARTFAEDWTAAWNALDIERVLLHFHDEVRFVSPTALAVVGVTTVQGKRALREYWSAAVARVGSLRFSIDRIVWDGTARELAIIYNAEIGGRKRRVSEMLRFGADDLVISGEVFHGVET